MSSALYKQLCRQSILYNAWKIVKKKNSAGGIDGCSITLFEENLKGNLDKLLQDIIDKTWNPEPYLRVEILKNQSEKRQLGLLTVCDKIVQQAIKSIIEPKLDKLFLGNSYGYRPGKGPVKAIHRVQHVFRQFKKGWVAKLDIDDFFNEISHERLFTQLHEQLKDPELIRLIELCVKTGVVTAHMKWSDTVKGVPQGAVLSPLLANFYLDSFDRFVLSQTAGYIRYADDFLIVTQSEESLVYTIYKIRNELEKKFHLKLNEPIISTLSKGIDFLG
ncbi:MAG: CRISPR-associated endonuclease Cas1, partial [Tannerellaceae bacterium]|nr:CRISPR-associated endonuclease Cas1 [Tannerellaceae bacterium]